jgi:phosphoglycerate dehydrogenase-like enzyme
MAQMKLVVITTPTTPHLDLLERLPSDVEVVTGFKVEDLRDAIVDADVILNGMNNGEQIKELFPAAKKIRWVHSLSAGVEKIMFPELIESPVPLTNARGVFAESLGEFVIAAALYFAKDFPRMRRSQAEGKWDQFDVDVLYRQSMAIVGYGEIGRAAARRAKALGMKVYATRRRPELLKDDPLVDEGFSVDRRKEMIANADYVVCAAAITPETRGLIGPDEFGAMKPNAVIMNVGRGPVIDEPAMIRALEQKKIRGAALDVFDTEPLPEGHPFWKLDNVLLSPHTADHIEGWLADAVSFFVENFGRFYRGEPLQNIVDKRAGY